MFERALAIHANETGSEHLEIVEDLYALADVYRAQDKANEAEALLKRAMSIRENHLGSEHPEVADSLDVLAWLYDTEKDFGKAEPLLKRALRIREKSLGTESFEVAQSLEELAGLYIAEGHSSDAKPLLERALAIREKDGNDTVADRHIERRFSLFRRVAHNDVEALVKRALIIRVVAFGQDHMRVAETLTDYVNVTGRVQELKTLRNEKKLIDEGLLSEDEAAAKRREILEELL